MCIRLESEFIAAEDIICYKAVRRTRTGYQSITAPNTRERQMSYGICTPPLRNTGSIARYKIGTTKRSRQLGYYVCSAKLDARGYVWSYDNDAILECVIPRGTKVLRGDSNIYNSGRYITPTLRIMREVSIDN
jgi:hypothetical protein